MTLDVIFTELNSNLEVDFESNNFGFDVDFGEVHVVNKGGYKSYDGSYEITPRLREQVLETSDKIMHDDLKIKEIPIARVSNPSGGTTVIIGVE